MISHIAILLWLLLSQLSYFFTPCENNLSSRYYDTWKWENMDGKYNLSKGSPRREHVKWLNMESSYLILSYYYDYYYLNSSCSSALSENNLSCRYYDTWKWEKMDWKCNVSKVSPRRDYVKWLNIGSSYPILPYYFNDYLAINVALLLLLNILNRVY